MTIEKQIQDFISSQDEPKRSELKEMHQRMLKILPKGKLWFDTGINEQNKVVTNPTIGYGLQVLHYANGTTKEFFQIGVSSNATGLSIYILGLKDKSYLATAYGKRLGKAKVTGYCIRFKSIKEIDLQVLEEAIRYGIKETKVS